MRDPLDLLKLIYEVATNDPVTVVLILIAGLALTVGGWFVGGIVRTVGDAFSPNDEIRTPAHRSLREMGVALLIASFGVLLILLDW